MFAVGTTLMLTLTAVWWANLLYCIAHITCLISYLLVALKNPGIETRSYLEELKLDSEKEVKICTV
jgi:hypothetical protein